LATDKFIWKSEDLIIAACVTCRHKREGGTCAAFPKGIPREILNGKERHEQPVKGDNGTQYEPKAGA
jgi:hypothetical protein